MIQTRHDFYSLPLWLFHILSRMNCKPPIDVFSRSRGLIKPHSPSARFAISWLPNPLLVHPLAQALFGLLAATWERKHAQVYSRAAALVDLVNRAADLSGMVPPMISTFLGMHSRIRTYVVKVLLGCR